MLELPEVPEVPASGERLMTGKSDDPPSLRDLRLMRLLIDVIGGERYTVSLQQVEEWLDQMCERPITTKAGDTCQLTKQQNSEGQITFWLSSVD
jgi:hypothetical protein